MCANNFSIVDTSMLTHRYKILQRSREKRITLQPKKSRKNNDEIKNECFFSFALAYLLCVSSVLNLYVIHCIFIKTLDCILIPTEDKYMYKKYIKHQAIIFLVCFRTILIQGLYGIFSPFVLCYCYRYC